MFKLLQSTLGQYKNLFILALVTALFGGSYLFTFEFFNIHIYAYRSFLIIALVIILFKKDLVLSKNKLSKFYLIFLSVWIIYAFISMYWCIDKSLAFKDIFYITVGLMTYLLVISLKNNYEEFLQIFSKMFAFAYIFTSLFLYLESKSGLHLPGSFTSDLANFGPLHPLHKTPFFTFDNPNHFSIFNSLAIILFVYQLLKEKNIILNSILICYCFILNMMIENRFSMLLLFLIILILIIYKFQLLKAKLKVQYIYLIFGAILFFGVYLLNETDKSIENLKAAYIKENKTKIYNKPTPDYLAAYAKLKYKEDKIMFYFDSKLLADLLKGKHKNVEISDAKGATKIGSNEIRKNLILNGFDFLHATNYRGVGAGNYSTYMKKSPKYNTGHIVDPHNLFIEILVQYGLLIFAGFVLIFLLISKKLLFELRHKTWTDEHFLLLALLFCFLIMGNANSTFLSLPINWIMLSLIIVISDEILFSKVDDQISQ